MKKFFKIILLALGVIILSLAGFAAFVHFSTPTFPVQKVDLKVEVTPERVARGKLLASMLCDNCHQNPSTKMLSGKKMMDLPKEFGEVFSKNITQHPTKGIGKWTDGEIAFLLRTGIKPNGQYLPPYMIKLPTMADEDINSIIAFLRSSDPTIQAADVDNIPSHPSFLVKFLVRIGAFKPFDYPKQSFTVPPLSNKVQYGEYLVNKVAHCYACHSADFKTNDYLEPLKSVNYCGGGNPTLEMNGKVIFSPNITFDKETGIGNWSEDDFIKAMKTGFRPNKTPIRYPMEKFTELSDDEIRAVYAYLQTVPMIKNANKTSPLFDPAEDKTEGQKLFHKYSCQTCHSESGMGWGDLTKAYQKYPTNEILKTFLKNPENILGKTKMLSWDGVIAEQDYEPLCNYVRELGERANKAQ